MLQFRNGKPSMPESLLGLRGVLAGLEHFAFADRSWPDKIPGPLR